MEDELIEGFNLIEHKEKVALFDVQKELWDTITKDLINVMLFKENKFVFVSKSTDELSFILSEDLAKDFEKYQVNILYGYRIIQICEDTHGIDHIGIVHKISGLFAKSKIPILYVNTYGNNFIIVSDEFYTPSIEKLKNIGFTIFIQE